MPNLAVVGYGLLAAGYAVQLVDRGHLLHTIGHTALVIGCGLIGLHYVRRMRASRRLPSRLETSDAGEGNDSPAVRSDRHKRLTELQRLREEGRIDRTVQLLLLDQIVREMSLDELDELHESGEMDDETYQVLRVQILERITGI